MSEQDDPPPPEPTAEEAVGEAPPAEETPSDPPPPPSLTPGAPVVTSLRPSCVDVRGGTTVTVFGAGFVPGSTVFVGETELVAEVIDTFTLRFVAPAGEGQQSVTVVSPGGKESPAGPDLAYALGPRLVRAIPDEVDIEGGARVIVEGERFEEGCALSLFGAHAPDVVRESPERVAFTAPAAGDGPLEGAVVLTNPSGLFDKSETLFRFRPLEPALTRIDPARGWVNGGKRVVLEGKDLHERARVYFGDEEAEVEWLARDRLSVIVPPAARPGPVDVAAVNVDQRHAVLERGFVYEPVPAPPKIIDVIPRTGLTTGGATVRITGDNFTDDVRVKIAEVTVVRRVLSSKLIDAELPSGAPAGPAAIEISLEGVTVRAEEAFTFTSPRAPKITHVEPRTGPVTGGTRVIIEGSGFPANASISFGGVPAKTVVVKDATRIEAVTPPMKAAGAVDVEVSSADTGPGVSKAGFGYEKVLPPTITLVAPNKGTIDGGTELTIEGKNFAEGATVLVDGLPAKTKRISGSLLEAKTPGGDDGKLVDVAVKNPDGQQAVQKRAFQYDARYRS